MIISATEIVVKIALEVRQHQSDLDEGEGAEAAIRPDVPCCITSLKFVNATKEDALPQVWVWG